MMFGAHLVKIYDVEDIFKMDRIKGDRLMMLKCGMFLLLPS